MPPEQRITAFARMATGAEIRDVERDGAGNLAVARHHVGEADVVDHADGGIAARLDAQRRADRDAGAQVVDVDAALAAVAGRLDLVDPAVVLARPVDVPARELADALRAAFAEQRREAFVAEPAPGFERILEVQLGAVGLRFAERGGAGHLRHDGRSAAPDHILVEQDHARARRAA